MIDYKRNNRVKCRNFNEACDFHDVVKLLIVRMLRREHPDHKNCQIYTEWNSEAPRENFPDVQMILTRRKIVKVIQDGKVRRISRKQPVEIVIYEIQKNVTKRWIKEITETHENVNLVIVPLKKLSKNIPTLIKQLEDYII